MEEEKKDNETERQYAIDLGCKATAVSWRSVVWSHSNGYLDDTLQAISKTSLTSQQILLPRKVIPKYDSFKDVYSTTFCFI